MIVALVLVSAFLHAAWNALLRIERDKDRALVAAVGVATVIAIAVATGRWIHGDVPFGTAAALGWAAIAGVFEWLYFVSLVKALSRGALGPVYTITRGGAIVVVWPLSLVLFDEPITRGALIGSAIVLAGLAAASARDGTASNGATAEPTDRWHGALAWAAACAVAIAGYHLAYKAALDASGSPSAVFAVALIVGSSINVARLGTEGRRVAAALIRARPWRVLLMGVVCGSSFLILMEALATGGAGFVLTLRNTSVLFATGLAAWIGERPRGAQIGGAILVAAGAVVMAWP